MKFAFTSIDIDGLDSVSPEALATAIIVSLIAIAAIVCVAVVTEVFDRWKSRIKVQR